MPPSELTKRRSKPHDLGQEATPTEMEKINSMFEELYAIGVLETDIVDGALLTRNDGDETITGRWLFTSGRLVLAQGTPLQARNAGNTADHDLLSYLGTRMSVGTDAVDLSIVLEDIEIGRFAHVAGAPTFTLADAGNDAQFRLRTAMDSGSYYAIGFNDASGALRFSHSIFTTQLQLITGDSPDLVSFSSTAGDAIIVFRETGGTIVFSAADGGGSGLVQFGRRITDDHTAVGCQAQFWPASGAGVPTLAQMAPGGATYQWRIENNGDMQFVVTAAKIYWAGRTQISSPADGQLLLTDTAGTSFARLMFGGTSASFPAVKRSSAALHVRLADDSAFANLEAAALTLSAGTGNVGWGTYTPTLTNVANLDASTAFQCQYIQVGSTVTVSGKVDIDPTVTATLTQLGISLPIASNIGAVEDVGGVAFASGIAGQGAAILGDAANNRAQLEYIAVDVTNQPMYFTFTYQVI